MLITLLAAAMTIAMLIATAFGLYEETLRARQDAEARVRIPFRRAGR